MDDNLASIYYSPRGYWQGLAAVKKVAQPQRFQIKRLAETAGYMADLPDLPRYIPRPMFDDDQPNTVHEADLLYFPHDRIGVGRKSKTYKYALTIVDDCRLSLQRGRAFDRQECH